MSHSALNRAILEFSNWQRPWLLPAFVGGRSDLTTEEKELFGKVLSAAHDPDHWSGPDRAACCRVAELAVHKAFPQLSEEAVKAVVQSASYDWR